MANKVFKRALTMCLAVILMIASSMGVVASEKSPGGGDIVPDPVIPARTTYVITKNNSIDLSFTQMNSVYYYVQWKSHNGTWDHCHTKKVTDLQYFIEGLIRGGRYDIRVRGVNSAGKGGEYCTEANRFMRSCSAYVTPKSGGFNVKVNKTNSEITGYKVYWTRDASFRRFNVMTVTGTTLNKTIAGKKGQTYYVRVVPISVVDGKTYTGVQNATHDVKIK